MGDSIPNENPGYVYRPGDYLFGSGVPQLVSLAAARETTMGRDVLRDVASLPTTAPDDAR